VEDRWAVRGALGAGLAIELVVEDGLDRAVAAGADLKGSKGSDTTLRSAARMVVHDFNPLLETIVRMDKPVIAAVSGHAVAGGLELALWCDLRVVEEDTVFGVFCRRWGVPLIDGGTVRLPRLIGESRALDLILTGRPVRAAEALQIGLANRVVPTGQSRAAAEALAHELAALPQRCLRSDRRSARHQWGRSESAALASEFTAGLEVLTSGESAAGAGRFVGGAGRGGKPGK